MHGIPREESQHSGDDRLARQGARIETLRLPSHFDRKRDGGVGLERAYIPGESVGQLYEHETPESRGSGPESFARRAVRVGVARNVVQLYSLSC